MKKLLVLLLALACAGPALAQRHIKRVSNIGAHVGVSEKGRYAELSYTAMLSNRLALRVGALREDGNLNGTLGDYASYQARVLLAPQLFRLGELVYFHLLFGGGGQYERTNEHGSGELAPDDAKPQRFTYGPQAGAEIDVFLGNRVSLVATGTKGYQFNNPLLDRWPGYAGVGLCYHFR